MWQTLNYRNKERRKIEKNCDVTFTKNKTTKELLNQADIPS